MVINKVVVIGATGAVGKTVSGIFASFGDAKVFMLGRDLKKLEKAKKDAALSVKAITIMDNLFIDTIDNLEEYVRDADLVFESVSEDLKTKEDIHKKINSYVDKDTIVALQGKENVYLTMEDYNTFARSNCTTGIIVLSVLQVFILLLFVPGIIVLIIGRKM